MNRELIIREIKTEVEKITGKQAKVQHIRKNNDIMLTGIVLNEESKMALSVYIDDLVQDIISGDISVREAAKKIVKIAVEEKPNEWGFDIESVLDKNYILKNVIFFLVSSKTNTQLKDEAPHRNYLNLTVFYRVIIKRYGVDGVKSYIVKNQEAEFAGVSEQKLFDAAMKNTKREGYAIKTMREIMSGMPDVQILLGNLDMFIISMKDGMWGASVLLYTDYIKELADKVDSDLYILPSSIHEVIAIPCNAGNVDELRSMVREINATEVKPEEVLGNDVYLYSRNRDLLTLA